MYCPNCGTQNSEDASFCRKCGLDLGTIARVMEKHLPQALLEKIDSNILNPKKSELYTSFLAALLSICLLAAAFYLSSSGYPRDTLYFLIGGGIAAVQAVWYLLIYIRSRSKTKMVLTTADYIEANRLADEKSENVLYAAKQTDKIAAQSLTEIKTNQTLSGAEQMATKKFPDER